MCAQALIPLCRILDELSKWFFEPNGVKSFKSIQTNIAACNMYSANQLQSIIYEDNTTCLLIANGMISFNRTPNTSPFNKMASFQRPNSFRKHLSQQNQHTPQLGRYLHQTPFHSPVPCTLQAPARLVIPFFSTPFWSQV